MLRITTRDVGLTQVATIWVGEARVIEFYTGTSHQQYSMEIAEELLAGALRDLITVYRGANLRMWTGEPGGYHDADS